MASVWPGLLLAVLASVGCRAEVETPTVIVELAEPSGFNISIPNAGKEMIEFKYFISVNQELKDAKESLFCKGFVECISDKSRFKLHRNLDMKEGDTLHFYLVGRRKPEGFQMERVYLVKKNDEGKLELQQESERICLEKEGLWYTHLDKLKETNP